MAEPNRPAGFKTASETGVIFAIYKDIGTCDCVPDPEALFHEPDPTHKACFGTGLKRSLFYTPKVRFMYTSITKSSNIEIQGFERMKDNMITIWLPQNINVGYTDIICSLKLDSNNNPLIPHQVEYVYKIIAVDSYIEDDFKFFAVKAAKLQHAPFEAIIR